jgi:hypothetical protein
MRRWRIRRPQQQGYGDTHGYGTVQGGHGFEFSVSVLTLGKAKVLRKNL